MSEILARIRVRETHGIRRFLYPVEVEVALPLNISSMYPKQKQLSLIGSTGQPVPFEKSPVDFKQIMASVGQLESVHFWNLRFPIFLAPWEETEFRFTLDDVHTDLKDPFQLYIPEEGAVLSSTPNDVVRIIQKRLILSLTAQGQVAEVIYDGVSHLRGETAITAQNNRISASDETWDFGQHATWTQQKLDYEDGSAATTRAQITAYKSWATMTHCLEQPKPQEEIVFTLPLAITSPTLTCDFGVGGYVFGKLDEKAPEVVWRTELGDAPHARWSVATAGRTDYVGEVETAETFLPQRWFHLIDSDKALAVAITQVPPDCREMTVRLTHEGDVTVAFRLGEAITGPAAFGVCYHFLNDVPAIAAATNPQSILLPPVVDVLPV